MKPSKKYFLPLSVLVSLTVAILWSSCQKFEIGNFFEEQTESLVDKIWQLEDVNITIKKTEKKKLQYTEKLTYLKSSRRLVHEVIPGENSNLQAKVDTLGPGVEELVFDDEYSGPSSSMFANVVVKSITLDKDEKTCLDEKEDSYLWGWSSLGSLTFEYPSDANKVNPLLATFLPHPRTPGTDILQIYDFERSGGQNILNFNLITDLERRKEKDYEGFSIDYYIKYKKVGESYCNPITGSGGTGINCDTSTIACVNGTIKVSDDSSRCFCDCLSGWKGEACDQSINRQVSVFSGSGQQGFADGPASSAAFNQPVFMTGDDNGYFFVTDANNHAIRKISPDGNVTTLAGTGVAGNQDGPGNQAMFNRPHGIARDKNGNFFVADNGNYAIRKISPDGTVSTVAGSGVGGYQNGALLSAQFSSLIGIFADTSEVLGTDVLLVADYGNNCIRKIDFDSDMVSIFVGSPSGFGSRNGPAQSARFRRPTSLTMDDVGNFYISDEGNNAIRKVTVTRGEADIVSTYTGTKPSGNVVGVFGNDPLNLPYGVLWAPPNLVYLTDAQNHRIRVLTDLGNGIGFGSNVAGDPGNMPGLEQGPGDQAKFSRPQGLYLDANNILYVCDRNNNQIRKLTQ